ncbi:MAG TPA: alkaline phosphatase D family protein [Pseudobdellovibrionaceae bacterium]|nr:alkaline phosphatase D family protein [Pseudobdellovibrionaceae bacterium]
MQGLTSESAALINIVAAVDDKIELKIEGGDAETRIEWREILWPKATEKIIRARATGLRLGRSYQLIVFRNQELVDRREFRALDSQASQFRLLIGSCMYDGERPEEIEKIWAKADERNPSALFLIGDNAYADLVEGKYRAPADGAQLWRRYAETMARLPLYRWKRLVPVLATWDDHDFGVNDGDRNHPHKEDARQVFLSFFPQENGFTDNWISGPGVSSRWTAFGFVFHFLDARSFRSPRGEAAGNPESQTQLGTEQENWVIQGLDSHRVNFLIKGDQWWGAYHRFESYEGSHPVSFKKWLKRLSDSASPTLLISGDRHLSEVMKIPKEVLGYETYELTASPVHARKYNGDWDKAPNPRQVHGMALANNWLELELTTRPESTRNSKSHAKSASQIQLRYWSEAGELYSQIIPLPRRATTRRAPPALSAPLESSKNP